MFTFGSLTILTKLVTHIVPTISNGLWIGLLARFRPPAVELETNSGISLFCDPFSKSMASKSCNFFGT